MPEDGGVAEVGLRLSAPSNEVVTVSYALVDAEAQSACPKRDFEASSGTLRIAPGEVSGVVRVLVADDDLAETDESLQLMLEVSGGALLDDPNPVRVVIDDDDRSRLIDASTYGVLPGTRDDSAPALQAALDAAAASGRGVVLVKPGDYELTTVTVPVGTTLSGRGAVFHRPARADRNMVTLRVAHEGPADGASTLIEGLSIDGRRYDQGNIDDFLLNEANLIHVAADSALAGRARLTLESLRLSDATNDGVALRDNADASVCDVQGRDISRELLSARGGNIRVVASKLRGSASSGTSGMRFHSVATGHSGSAIVEADVLDVALDSGDLELDISSGSRFTARQLRMDQAPLRIIAPDSVVRIADSVLATGIPSHRLNYFRVPHDVEIKNSVLVLWEREDEFNTTPEANRDLVFAAVTFSLQGAPAQPGTHRLVFDHCQFVLSPDVEPTDTVSVVRAQPGGSVLVKNGSLGPGIQRWFADPCSGCQLSP